jgi:cellobiose epimerase
MDVQRFKLEMQEELDKILRYWIDYSQDPNGGFVGRIDNDNRIYADAPKGSVLNARILWTFSSAFNATGNNEYLKIADKAFNYITEHFIDKEFDGVFWSVDSKGEPLDTKKQVYAIAFVVYALSEYFRSSNNEAAQATAIRLYHLIENHSSDKLTGGYLEAFSRNWTTLDDLRLSAKDANEKKTMNTHLHILEAYTNLYRIWPSLELAHQLRKLVNVFLHLIINTDTGHLNLFFDENWKVKSVTVSYGHDIEASWLLLEASESLKDEELISRCKAVSVKMANAVIEGLDTDGGLWYEYEPSKHHLVKQKHWWPQAEAMVGFVNAWQVSKDDKYLQHAFQNWHFVKGYILDKQDGEWFWGINEDYSVMKNEDKIGIWKCPYHNSRACLEIIKRLNAKIKEQRTTNQNINN